MGDLDEAVRLREQARRRFEDEVVAAERAFAARVAQEGIPAAFLAVLSDDSVICGQGPEPGRAAYEALPRDYPGGLEWDPRLVGASSDGTLAFTSGPYRALDGEGRETGRGIYFSIWRRSVASKPLELVLDFGMKGGSAPGKGDELKRLEVPAPCGRATMPFLQACLQEGLCPDPGEALRLGDPSCLGMQAPSGCFGARNGELGVLWGARTRSDGSTGAFAMVYRPGKEEPVPWVCLCA